MTLARTAAVVVLVCVVSAHASGPAALYARLCAPCHGVDGRGDGEGAYLLVTPPRNFHTARYRLVSTWTHRPTDDDLFETITRGIPGTPMPSWASLPEADRRALVGIIKGFADQPWASPAPDDVIVVPTEPSGAASDPGRGAALYRDACATCHGPNGHGDGRSDLRDDDGSPIRPRDFSRGAFKGERVPSALYRRIVAGMPGTPMPAHAWAYGDDAWFLVRYVLSLAER
jgi:cytochrome c